MDGFSKPLSPMDIQQKATTLQCPKWYPSTRELDEATENLSVAGHCNRYHAPKKPLFHHPYLYNRFLTSPVVNECYVNCNLYPGSDTIKNVNGVTVYDAYVVIAEKSVTYPDLDRLGLTAICRLERTAEEQEEGIVSSAFCDCRMAMQLADILMKSTEYAMECILVIQWIEA